MSNQTQFWTQPTGSLFFFFNFIVAQNHVVVAAVLRLNKATARIADLTSVDAKRQFDAGLIAIAQKPCALIRYYTGRQDLLTRKRVGGLGQETRVYARTDFEVHVAPAYGVQWYKLCWCDFCRSVEKGANSIHCYFGSMSSNMEISTNCDIVRSAPLPENIPTVFGQGNGTCVDDVVVFSANMFCQSRVSSIHPTYFVTARHDEISTANQRRFIYQEMVDAILSHLRNKKDE